MGRWETAAAATRVHTNPANDTTTCAHTTTTTHHNRTQALPAGLPAGKPFALLLPRGRCPFEQKAVAAEAAGAALAIIYNNEEVRCAFQCVGAACACVVVDLVRFRGLPSVACTTHNFYK